MAGSKPAVEYTPAQKFIMGLAICATGFVVLLLLAPMGKQGGQDGTLVPGIATSANPYPLPMVIGAQAPVNCGSAFDAITSSVPAPCTAAKDRLMSGLVPLVAGAVVVLGGLYAIVTPRNGQPGESAAASKPVKPPPTRSTPTSTSPRPEAKPGAGSPGWNAAKRAAPPSGPSTPPNPPPKGAASGAAPNADPDGRPRPSAAGTSGVPPRSEPGLTKVVKMAAGSLKPGDPVHLDGKVRTVSAVYLQLDGWAVTVDHDGGRHRFSNPLDLVQVAIGGS